MRAVNLLPAEQRGGVSVGAGRSQGGAYAVLATAGGLAAMAFLYGHAHHQISSRRGEVASITAQAQQAQDAAERLAPYTSFVSMREQRAQAVETLVDSRFDWAHAFHELGRVLPSAVSVSSLSGTIGAGGESSTSTTTSSPTTTTTTASSVSSSTPPGSVPTFTLTGCATSQASVALMLERLRLIDGVDEVTLQSSTAGSTGGGGCPSGYPAYALQIDFDALPATTAAASAVTTVADSATSAGSSRSKTATAPSTTTTKASLR